MGGGGGVLTIGGPSLTGANSLEVGTNGTPAGTVMLAGANTYTGPTQIDGGVLSVAVDNNLARRRVRPLRACS